MLLQNSIPEYRATLHQACRIYVGPRTTDILVTCGRDRADASTEITDIAIELVALALLTVAVIAAAPLKAKLVAHRRQGLQRNGLPHVSIAILQDTVPLYRRIPLELRERLHGDMSIFLAEKSFIGRGGLQINEQIRLSIAAQACVLPLNQVVRHYPDFTSIIVYPDSYLAPTSERDGPLESTGTQSRAGESWYRGPVVLSWADIREDLDNPGCGHNVVLHEFAHKLDELDGSVDGAPPLSAARGQRWQEIFQRDYDQLRAALARGESTFLDAYAASAPTEFFAVAVETFFEQPDALRKHHAELYHELQQYFDLDPAAWPDAVTH